MPKNQRVCLHDMSLYTDGSLTPDGKSLGVVSLINYAWRAALLDHICVVPRREGGEAYHRYLRGFGLGASRVIQVDGDNLYDGCRADPSVMQELRNLFESGAECEHFATSAKSEAFDQELGVCAAQLRSPARHVMAQLDDKANLRELARAIDALNVFPEFRYATEPAEIRVACAALLDTYEIVFVKRPDLESGTGCMPVSRETFGGDAFTAFLREFATGARELIVEEGVFGTKEDPMIDCSIQFHLDAAGQANQLFASLQYMEGPDKNVHAGNLIAASDTGCLPLSWDFVDRYQVARGMFTDVQPFIDWALTHHGAATGRLGFDLRVNRTRRVILEGNYRYTAASYPEAVRWQLVRSGRLSSPCVIMRNIHLPESCLWQDLPRRFGMLGFNGNSRGVLVCNPFCCESPADPKFVAICVGNSRDEAEWYLAEVKRLFA